MSEQVITGVFNIFARTIEKKAAKPEPDHMEAAYAELQAEIQQTPGDAA